MIRSSASTFVLVAIGAALLAAAPLFAQTVTATLQGTVSDPNGEPVTEASVTASGEGMRRSATTGPDGRYRITPLPPGSYTLTIERSTFQTKTVTDLELNVDRTLTVDVTLELAAVEAEVTVVGRPPLIDFNDPATTQVIDTRTIDNIPLNGRNYLDLVLLTPGVTVNSNARDDFGSLDTTGAILGERGGNVGFLIDGHENNDDLRGGVFLDYNQDTIQEFEVIQTGYKAEFGRGSGGIVNVVTHSGSDAFRASAFAFARDDSLDASNVPGEDPPKLERDDLGFTLGGPLQRQKSWFFTSAESIDETREAIFPQDVPEVLAAMEDFSRQPESESTRAFFKWTHQVNESNDLRVDMGYGSVENRNQLAASDSLPSNSNNNDTDSLNANAALTTILGSEAFLESSLNYRDQSFDQNQGLGDAGTSFSVFLLDQGVSFSFGPPGGSVVTLDQSYLGLRESFSLFRGPHGIKTGVQYLHTEVDGVNGQGLIDVIVTITPFLELYGVDSFQIPQGVALLDPGDEITRLRNDGVALFGQDDWLLTDDVTLSLGLRWDYDSKFDDSDNIAPRLGLVWRIDDRTMLRANAGIFYDRYRLGIAQTVPELGGIDQTTVAELNFPRLLADVLIPFPGTLNMLNFVVGNPFLLHERYGLAPDVVLRRDNVEALTGLSPQAFLADLNAFAGGFGIPMLPLQFSPATGFLRQDISAPFVDQVTVERPFDTPSNTTYSLGVERQLGESFLLTGTLVHREIDDVLGLRITNLAFESRQAGTPITTDGEPLARTYGGFYDGEYDAFIVSLEKRFRGRYQLLGSYTYADAEDNLLNPNLGLGILTQGGGAVPTDNLDLEADRGNSDLAVDHNFVLSGVAVLPLGFTVSGVLRLQSGLHFSAAGPPTDVDGDGIVSPRPPETRRNQFEGPSFQNLDVRVEKSFSLAGGHEVSILAEAFNVTNEDNARVINNAWIDGMPGPDFGKVRVPLPGREIQLGVRWRFGARR